VARVCPRPAGGGLVTPAEADARIAELHAAATPYRRIAAEVGLSPWAVRRRLQALGLAALPRTRPRVVEPRNQRVVMHFTATELAELRARALVLGVTVPAMVRELAMRKNNTNEGR
jgi:DNA-binding Lrp family transcriptional regulator